MVGGDADPGPLTEAAGVRPSTSERREGMEPSDQVASQRTHWQEENAALTLAQGDSRRSPGPRRSSRSGHRQPVGSGERSKNWHIEAQRGEDPVQSRPRTPKP